MTAAMIEFFAHFGAAERLYREAADLNRAGCLDFVGSIRFLSALGFLRKISGQETEGQALMLEARALEQSDLKLAPKMRGACIATRRTKRLWVKRQLLSPCSIGR